MNINNLKLLIELINNSFFELSDYYFYSHTDFNLDLGKNSNKELRLKFGVSETPVPHQNIKGRQII